MSLFCRKNCLVGEICGSPIRSNGARKLGDHAQPRESDVRLARLPLLLFVASCLSIQTRFALSGKRYTTGGKRLAPGIELRGGVLGRASLERGTRSDGTVLLPLPRRRTLANGMLLGTVLSARVIAVLLTPSFALAQPRPAQFMAPPQFHTAVGDTGNSPLVASGDFNHDGYKDLAIPYRSTIYLILGGPTGFTNGAQYQLGNSVTAIAAADFNGDGNLDLAVITDGAQDAFIFFGKGDGTFSDPTSVATPKYMLYMTAGDFNGDGKADLAFTSGGYLYTCLGHGDGTFGPVSIASGAMSAGAQMLIAGDFHGTGKDDLIVGGETFGGHGCTNSFPCFTVNLFSNTGRATFEFDQLLVGTTGTNVPSVAVADLNSDGALDLVMDRLGEVGDSLTAVFMNDGKGNLTRTAQYLVESSPVGIAAVDINGDGIPDIITANSVGSVSVLLGNGDGTFGKSTSYAANSSPVWVDVGPYYGKDQRDLVVFNLVDNAQPTSTALSLIRTSSSGEPQAPVTTYLPALGPGALADMNGDGIPDLLVNTGSVVAVLPGSAGGVFGQALASVSVIPSNIVVADFNLDGRPDFAACDSYTGELHIALQEASGRYSDRITAENGCQTAWAGDLNGDGIPDLIMLTDPQDFRLTNMSVLLGKGNGAFSPPVSIGSAPYTFTIGDFNGDGKWDIAFCNPFEGQPACPGIMFGNGDGTFQAPVYTSATTQGYVITSGDFNNDGKLDLAIVVQQPIGLIVLLGKGDGTFTQLPINTSIQSVPEQIVVGDFNGDGNVDLLLAMPELQILLGEGNGHFVPQPGFLPGIFLVDCQAFAADMNGDGKLDIVTLDVRDAAGPGAIGLLLNKTP